jgi:hypothetical protein
MDGWPDEYVKSWFVGLIAEQTILDMESAAA